MYMWCTFTPPDTPAAVFIATDREVLQAEYNIDSLSHELWTPRPPLGISGAFALDVDVMENKIYWINKMDKVSGIEILF